MRVFYVRKTEWVNQRHGESQCERNCSVGLEPDHWVSSEVGIVTRGSHCRFLLSLLFFLENSGRAILRKFTLKKKCYFSEEVFHWTKLTFIDQRQKFTISCGISGIFRAVGEVIFYFICVTTIVSNLPQSHKVSPIWGFNPNCHPCLDMALQ